MVHIDTLSACSFCQRRLDGYCVTPLLALSFFVPLPDFHHTFHKKGKETSQEGRRRESRTHRAI